MGWCSGSDIFYDTVSEIVHWLEQKDITQLAATNIVSQLYNSMKAQDWDCDDPMCIDWVDKIMGYTKCPTCNNMVYGEISDDNICWGCEE